MYYIENEYPEIKEQGPISGMIVIFNDCFCLKMEIKGPGFLLRGWKTEDAESLQRHADNSHIADFYWIDFRRLIR